MPETILLVLIVAKIKKYNLKEFFKSKALYIVFFFEFLYIIMQITFFKGNYELLKYTAIFKVLYLCSYLGLVFKNLLYKEAFIGSVFMIIGGVCNDLAIFFNDGKMPVYPTLSYVIGYTKAESFEIAHKVANDFHVLGDSQTKMKFLTDIFDFGYTILSIGDIFIRVFVFLVLYASIKKMNETTKQESI